MNSKNPYYIVAPSYIRTSASVRVLYKLCNLINKAGGSAFIYLKLHLNFDLASSPMDVAHFLTTKIVDYHFKNRLNPVVAYPETFRISNFSAPVRIRYILNYDDLLFKKVPPIFAAMRCVNFSVVGLNPISQKSSLCCVKL